MARRDPQINIRLSEELKQKVHEKAEANGRSVNAELVDRIEVSLLAETSPTNVLTAEDAKKIAEQALKDGYARLLSRCIKYINSRAMEGYSDAYISSGYEDIYEGDKIYKTVIAPVKIKLEELGYKVSFSGEDYHITFY
jgi:plasmid stability protein